MDKTALCLLMAQVILLVFFCIFARYDTKYKGKEKYSLFQDVGVMIFLGFGCLMMFMKRYGFSSLGFTLLAGSFLIQWSMLCQGFYNLNDNYKIELGIESMYEAELAAATFMISIGAMIGKLSVIQMFVLGFIEIPIYYANLYLGTQVFKVADAGGSIFIHAFGAYFGLAASYVTFRNRNMDKEVAGESLKESNYTSDIFAMIGTIFLWMYWPSFNAIELQGLQQERAILNTYLALLSCCLSTFAASIIFTSERKFDMTLIQNGTLAGGVAVGTSANLMLQPAGAVAVGLVAGFLSVFGFQVIMPFVERKLKISDVCGIHNLHGMPAILAAIVSAIMAGVATEAEYHSDLYDIYPARATLNGTLGSVGNEPRGAGWQAGYQCLGLVVTIGIAASSGVITGFLLSVLDNVQLHLHFDDATYWVMHEPSKLELTVQNKSVDEDSSKQHDNLGFDISIIDGNTITDECPNRQVDTV